MGLESGRRRLLLAERDRGRVSKGKKEKKVFSSSFALLLLPHSFASFSSSHNPRPLLFHHKIGIRGRRHEAGPRRARRHRAGPRGAVADRRGRRGRARGPGRAGRGRGGQGRGRLEGREEEQRQDEESAWAGAWGKERGKRGRRFLVIF